MVALTFITRTFDVASLDDRAIRTRRPERPVGTTVALLATLTSLLLPGKALSQEAHYWSEQFGNRSMLLSGTVIGSVSDLGAVFYNPGRLALTENPAFVLSAKVYQWDRYTVKDGIGEGADLKESQFGGAPNLVAGSFTLPFLEDHQFAYSFLTRRRAESQFSFRAERFGVLVEGLPGESYLEGTINAKDGLKEEWIGVTWSRNWWEGISLGFSTFATIENRSRDLAIGVRAVNQDPQAAVKFSRRSYRYSHYGLLWKAGLAMVFDRWLLGLTVTTPKLDVHGTGSVKYEELLAGLASNGDGVSNDLLETSFQGGLDGRAKSPWAVGMGLGWDKGEFAVHLSGEWYSSIPEYRMVSARPFEGQSTGITHTYSVVDEGHSIFNVGLGLEWRASETFSAYASVATDRSVAPPDGTIFLQGKDFVNDKAFAEDFFLSGGGFTWVTRWADLTLGATYAAASQLFDRPPGFPGEGDSGIQSEEGQVRYRYSRWRFLLGFSIPFAKDIADRVKGPGEDRAPPRR